MNETNQARYSAGAMILHWLLAIGVIVNWRLAESAHEGPREAGASLMAIHKSIGIAILVLTLFRIVWRLTHRAPPLAAHMATWERVLARVTHAIFYFLLIVLPLLGWIGTTTGGRMLDWFGIVELPGIAFGASKQTGHTLLEVHHVLGTAMIYLMFLHILGALKHTFWDRDGNLFRMLPFGSPRA